MWEKIIGIIDKLIDIYIKRKTTQENPQDPQQKQSEKPEIPWNVPFRRNKNFTGREGDMMRLKKMLGHGSIVTIDQVSQIKGMGGVGKTQLAVEYAYENKDKYPGGILWVGGSLDVLAEYAKLIDVLKLGLADNMPERDKCLLVQDCLNHRQDKTLLVLDNQDDKKAYEEIRDYLPNIGNCRILITTRLKDLEDGEGLSLDILSDDEAKQLLYKESSRKSKDEIILNICNSFDNLPVAIKAAGRYLKRMKAISFEEYHKKLIQSGLSHRSLQDGKKLHKVDHKASVKAILAVNEELMENGQIRKILSAVTCFEPESINPQLLALVCGMDWENDKEEIWELVTTLDNYSIIEIQEDNRLNIHRLMRKALCEQIPEEEVKTIQQVYVLQLLKWFNENLYVTKLKITTPEISHILEAAQIALKNNIWPQSYNLCIDIGKYYDCIGRYRQSLSWREKSESEVKANAPDDQKKLALSYNEIGLTWNSLGKYQKAIEFYEQALAIDRKVYGEKHERVAIRLNNLGLAWNSLGDYHKAIEFYDQAIDIWKGVYGEKHSQLANSLNNLGSTWSSLGEYEKAFELYEEALTIDQEILGKNHPNIARYLSNQGTAWSSLGEYKKAFEFFQRALDIWKDLYGEKHPQVAIGLNNLGSAWDSLGEHEKAIEFLEQALVIDRKVYGEKHPQIAIRLNNLGIAWRSLGNVEKAREYWQQAYEITQEFLPEDHPYNISLKEKLDSLPS